MSASMLIAGNRGAVEHKGLLVRCWWIRGDEASSIGG